MDKMRLIEISALQGKLHPVNVLIHSNRGQYFLKALNAAKYLWRESSFLFKNLDKSARTEANLVGNF